MTKKHKVLVVDDEKGVRKLLEAMLEKKGYEAFGAEDAEQALDILGRETFGLVITDLRLPGLSGEELLERLKQGFPNVPVVVISAFGKTKNIVDVIKRGAEDYLSKPFTLEDLEVVVLKALEKHKLLTENQRLRQEIAGGTGPLVGKSRAITKVLEMIEKFAASDAHVLITGESGVGKELAARAIHEMSACSDGPLIQVNAGALPHSLFEAELFGVKKGAYTGATENREGLFQAADRGTLFLDEIAEVPLESQAKLLRVLESGEVKPLGDNRHHKVKVRVIAATNQDLEEMVDNRTFRKDLFYRLSILWLPIPPLRERLEDISPLADFFLAQMQSPQKIPKKLSADAFKWLLGQKWPGNVRELKNILERASLLSDQTEILPEDLILPGSKEPNLMGGLFRQTKKLKIEAFERDYLTGLLKDCKGNVSKAALRAGLARRNFQSMVKKHKLNPAQFRRSGSSDR
jgi:DNA-binding NtrC family response regulator